MHDRPRLFNKSHKGACRLEGGRGRKHEGVDREDVGTDAPGVIPLPMCRHVVHASPDVAGLAEAVHEVRDV